MSEQLIKAFVDTVCSQIKCKDIHEEIKLELESHIEETAKMHVRDGLAREEAIKEAIHQMGDPVVLGKQLHQTHRPKTEWGLLGALFCLTGVGLLALYSIDVSQTSPFFSLFARQMFFEVIGICLAGFLFFFDYQKIKPFSSYLYWATILAMGWSLVGGTTVNGKPYLYLGAFKIDIMGVSPTLLIIALGGMLANRDWQQPRALLKPLLWLALPILFYLKAPSSFSIVLYVMSFLVLMIVSKATKTQVLMAGAGIVAFLGGLFCFALSSRPYLYERLITFLNPYRDPQGSGYQLVQSIASMRQAGLWGQGFGARNQVVPYVYSDFIFTYIVYALGWVVGAALLLVVAFFIIRMIQAARRVKDPYGMLVISGTASIFSVQFVWAILMTMGFVPVAGTSLPFISYGGSQFVLQMAAMGLILSIYRRKDIRRRNTV